MVSSRLEDDWQVLRQLLVGEEAERIARLESEPAEPAGKDLAKVLPEVVTRAVSSSPALALSLESTIEAGLENSARKNPAVLAEAIYPALGPAIRRMIQSLLSDALEGFNSAMENTLSPAGIRWRLESWRTGRPFREVVLLHSLEWRVEQVFLIHKQTGLLLQEASVIGRNGPDPELVSGMLTAIQDFVRDSFAEGDEGDLEQVELSGYRILIAQGPVAVLAAVVSGSPPAELHVELEDLLLELHVEHARKLQDFEGDSVPFVALQPALESCLREQVKTRRKSVLGPFLLMAGLTLMILLGLRWWWLERQGKRDVGRLVEMVQAEPGLLLLDWERDGSQVRMTGLADPLARDAQALAQISSLDERVEIQGNWRPFVSGDAGLVLKRAKQLLEPPDGVELSLEQGALVAKGESGAAWIGAARRIALQLTGTPLGDAGLLDLDAASMQRLVAALDGQLVPFGLRAERLDWGDPVVAGRLAQIAELDAAAAAAGRSVGVELLGAVSEQELNSPGLGEGRAAAVWAAIHAKRPRAILAVTAPENPAGPRRSPTPGVLLSVRLLPLAGGLR